MIFTRSVSRSFVALLVLAGSMASARGEESPSRNPEEASRVRKILVGASYRNFDYVETSSTNPHLDDEKGNMPGLNLGYRGVFSKYFFNGDLTVISSHTTYHGSNQSGTIPVVSSTKTALIELEADVGMPFAETDSGFKLWGYSGLGYHYWRRGQAGSVNGVSTYREDYAWLVLPIGLRLEQALGDRVKIGLDVAARLSLAGTLNIKLSEIQPSIQDPEVDLGSKMGYKIQLPLEFQLSPTMELVLTPWYEYSAIGQSNTVELRNTDGSSTGLAIMEPDSRTKQAGVTLQAGFVF